MAGTIWRVPQMHCKRRASVHVTDVDLHYIDHFRSSWMLKLTTEIAPAEEKRPTRILRMTKDDKN
jgi:hypothetical protein